MAVGMRRLNVAGDGRGVGRRDARSLRAMFDALVGSEGLLDQASSDRMFERLMARMAAEEARRQRHHRVLRMLGAALGGAVAALGALHFLGS
jgi:hypothetical protein